MNEYDSIYRWIEVLLQTESVQRGTDAKATGLNNPSDLGILLFNDVAEFYAKVTWFDGLSEGASWAAF